jgi:hypothetical protein
MQEGGVQPRHRRDQEGGALSPAIGAIRRAGL